MPSALNYSAEAVAPSPQWVESRHRSKLIPARAAHAYPRPTSSRGAAIRRHVVWRGEGGALRPGLHPGLGRLREPPWAYYGACARSSLEGSGYPKPDAERVTRR